MHVSERIEVAPRPGGITGPMVDQMEKTQALVDADFGEGICPGCGKKKTTILGLVASHGRYYLDKRGMVECPGTDKKPKRP